MTLDEAVGAFHENPTPDTAQNLSNTATEYFKDGIIEFDTANKYLNEVDYYLMTDVFPKLAEYLK
jgi:hypothetical protein